MADVDDLLTDRIPPADLPAERAVLGITLTDPDALPRVIEVLQPSDFMLDAHRLIFGVCIELFERIQPVDVITVMSELKRTERLDAIGGPALLAGLIDESSTATNLLAYCAIIREKAVLRNLIQAATEIMTRSYQQLRPDAILTDAQQILLDVDRQNRSTTTVRALLRTVYDQIERLSERQDALSGLPSGYRRLDRLTAGFQTGDLILLAARPSMGKTSLALDIARYVGGVLKQPVLFLSLEMSSEQLVHRLLCAEARVDSQRARTGELVAGDWDQLNRAAERLAESRIAIDDTPALTILQARAKARRIMAESGLSLVIIDYLQLMRGSATGRHNNRQEEVSEISRALKAMARELRVPVIALSQLSRAIELRKEPRPQLSDLRESGALEQDADLIMFLYAQAEDTPLPVQTDLIIGKQRNGPLGTVQLTFVRQWAAFEEPSWRVEPDLAAD